RALELGVSQISGGSKTSVGGYADDCSEDVEDSAQFDVTDRRPLDEVIKWLLELGYLPSFCTACYRRGRTGDNFMDICKSKEIHHFCHPNAILTLKEYLEDYASETTKSVGNALIKEEVEKIDNNDIKEKVLENLKKIEENQRDFCF
ncbi:MAG: [FeFe] hydrogenase H-cluster radical SAM maturase HydG, partial [Candidatus Gastranaerophilaceae bacterium]